MLNMEISERLKEFSIDELKDYIVYCSTILLLPSEKTGVNLSVGEIEKRWKSAVNILAEKEIDYIKNFYIF